MSEIANQLPTDIDALQALLAAARAERDTALAERDQALSQNDRLRHLLLQLQRAHFGRRSEKLDPEQLQLALEDVEQAVAGNEAATDKKDPAGARTRIVPNMPAGSARMAWCRRRPPTEASRGSGPCTAQARRSRSHRRKCAVISLFCSEQAQRPASELSHVHPSLPLQ